MPQNEMFPIEVRLSRRFQKKLKDYRKKYPSILKDIGGLVEVLKTGATPGDRLQGTDTYLVFKERIANSDNNKGKSHGYRLCYVKLDPNEIKQVNIIVLLIIYAKNDQEDIRPEEILDIIAEYHEEVDTEE